MVPTSISDFEDAVRAAVDPVAVPSVAYGIARGEETLLLGAVGLADKAGVRATAQTPYALASVTKPMTATAVAMLAERGLVELDAPVERYLAGMRLEGKAGDPGEATVRRVAGHTAGLPLHYRFYYEDEGLPRRPFEEVVGRYGKLFFRPGERHVYSNLGYGLLDALVADVSGTPYGRFMADELFGPLGMKNASIGAGVGAAVSYGPDGVVYPRYDTDHPGGSAAFASVEDLLRFGRFHLGGGPPLLSLQSRRAMQAPTLGYGLGWGVAERHGLRIVGHTGGMGGVSTILRLVPSLELVIAVVANGEGGVPSRAADDALAALDVGFREGLRTARAEAAPIESRTGVWSGSIETPGDRLPFALELREGDALARLDGREGFVDDLSLAEEGLRGTFDGDLRTEDVADRPYRIHLDLRFGSDRLSGTATAVTRNERPGGAPGRRLGDALSFWSELERA